MRSGRPRTGWSLALAACVTGAGLVSLRRGKDANWDLLNYHWYDVHAFLHGRLGWDLAPAQAQTYHSPFADLLFHALAHALDDPRHVAFAMALPAGIAAFFLLRALAILFPAGAPHRLLSIGTAAAIGLTGAAGVSVVGSTMNEWHCAALLVPALYVGLREASSERASARAIAAVGLLAGIAVGLKLTYGVFAAGLVVALASWGSWRERLARVGVAGAGALAGFVLAYGPWAFVLQRELASPFFPYFNDFFQSPWWEAQAWRDRRFGPRDAFEALTFPVWFSHRSALVAEGSFRDYRLAAAFVLGLLVAVRALARRRSPLAARWPAGGTARAWRLLVAFTIASYAAWLALFSIYRYLVPLELVSGALIVAAVAYLVPGAIARRAAIVLLALPLLGTTRFMGWERVPFGARYFDVVVPAVERDALVIVGHVHPMAYAIPSFPRDTRFVSPVNNLLTLEQRNLLARKIDGAIRKHEGAIYLLEHRRDPELNAATLAHFRLAREEGACATIRSDLDRDAMRLCRLRRGAPG